MSFKVIIGDNFHYMDATAHTVHGAFATAELARRAAQGIVDAYLVTELRPGMNADQLYDKFVAFGDDPFIVSTDGERVSFSAWDYARERCVELCPPV